MKLFIALHSEINIVYKKINMGCVTSLILLPQFSAIKFKTVMTGLIWRSVQLFVFTSFSLACWDLWNSRALAAPTARSPGSPLISVTARLASGFPSNPLWVARLEAWADQRPVHVCERGGLAPTPVTAQIRPSHSSGSNSSRIHRFSGTGGNGNEGGRERG